MDKIYQYERILMDSDSEIFNLSLKEIAFLEITNDIHINNLKTNEGYERIVITTKETYIWASIIATIVEKFESISEEQILNAYLKAVGENKDNIIEVYNNFRLSDSTLINLNKQIMDDFKEILNLEQHFKKYGINVYKIYMSLVRRGYIEDPVFQHINGVQLAVIGLMPIGFSQKTRKGEIVSRQINALLWSYEMEKKNGVKDVEFKININPPKLMKLINIIKALKKIMPEFYEALLEINKNKDEK